MPGSTSSPPWSLPHLERLPTAQWGYQVPETWMAALIALNREVKETYRFLERCTLLR
jgi:hypothetical protein